jgi:hypothetical protein
VDEDFMPDDQKFVENDVLAHALRGLAHHHCHRRMARSPIGKVFSELPVAIHRRGFQRPYFLLLL